MKSKLLIICLLLLALCSISSVAAQDANNQTDIFQNNNEAIENGDASIDEDSKLLLTNDNVLSQGSFDDLQKKVNNASEGSTLVLDTNYQSTDNILKIDKTITIDGKGHTINCSKQGLKSSAGTITIKNLIFVNGKNDDYQTGGCIYITGSAKYIVINCTFKNNYAKNYGGAIFNNVEDTLTIINSTFTNNNVDVHGGAIYSKGDIVVKNSKFLNNAAKRSGGAIYSQRMCTVTDSVFDSNKAESDGGAIISKKDLTAENSKFTNNKANDGGAVFTTEDGVFDKCIFTGNNAKSGGAIYSNGVKRTLINDCILNNNVASSGSGGAVYSYKWTHVDNSTFTGNTADGKGGAIYTDYISFGINGLFQSNTAKNHGGAIYTSTISNDITNVKFIGNKVTADFGGALYINNKCKDITFKSCSFINNSATAGDGGAIHSDSSSTNLKFLQCTFTGNTAAGGKERRYGGAIRSNGVVNIDNCTFANNWAENYGGAIYTEKANEIKNSVFISNQIKNGGKRDGGAIYINKECTININGCYFEFNNGVERGGVLYTDSKNAHLRLTNNAFIGNSASGQGVTVFNSGYYDAVNNNWWGANGVPLRNQLKEYHTFGSNTDKNDDSPVSVSVSGDKNSYVDVKASIKISFTGNVPYYTFDKISYSSDKKGVFVDKKVNGNFLELKYIPNETGIHKITISVGQFQKLTFETTASYISVYGYDLNKVFGEDKYYSAVFKDSKGYFLANDTAVKFNINNVNYTGYVTNGIASLYANLQPGNYTVKAINPVTNQTFTNKLNIKERNMLFNINDPYVVQFNSKYATNSSNVTFTINGKTFNSNISEDGIAYFRLNVAAGKYTVTTKFGDIVIQENITVSNKFSNMDLGLNDASYGSFLPISGNETFTIKNLTMVSSLGDNLYRYVLPQGEAFILYNVTASNTAELTNVLRKISAKEFRADVIIINLKKETYKVTDNFWRDQEWYYLIHLTHGTLFINGNGATLDDGYHHNFMALEPSTRTIINNVTFKKFYRVFSSAGDVSCTNSVFIENNAKFFQTKTPASVIYNKYKASFENCIFDHNKNDDVTFGSHDENTMGGVLYGEKNSVTNFIKCQFKAESDNVRAVDKSMIVVYDDDFNAYNHIVANGYLETAASISIMKTGSYNKNNTLTYNISSVDELLKWNRLKDGKFSLIYRLYNVLDDATAYVFNLAPGVYNAKYEHYRDKHQDEWRTDYQGLMPAIVQDEYLVDVGAKPVVINGHGATIAYQDALVFNDYHFAYVPKSGSLTLVNMTIKNFNTAIINYGTFIAINCTFENNRINHISKTGDFGGAVRNYGHVYCYNSTFKDNGANAGGAYYSDDSANALFSNCTFSNNKIVSKLVWKNGDPSNLHITGNSVVKLVNCKGIGKDSIKLDKSGICLTRDSLGYSVYNAVVDSISSLIKVSKIVKNNKEYDIINVTFKPGSYAIFPDSNTLFEMDYGMLILNGNGARVFVSNPKDSDETKFLTTTSRSTVNIVNLSIEGFNMAIINSGSLTITNSSLNNNRVDYNFKEDYGGAIVNKGGILNVLNTTFNGNYAKYGGAVYTTSATHFIISTFTNNYGYNSKSNVDIYNKQGSVEIVSVTNIIPKITEKNPAPAWKVQMLETGIFLVTLAVTMGSSWAISATGVAAANLISMGAGALIGGSFGALEGFIYSNDHQDYSSFWVRVLKGVANGISFVPYGAAANKLAPITDQLIKKAALDKIYAKFVQQTVKLTKEQVTAMSKKNSYEIMKIF